ncbi:MAG: hypothetical protein M3P06_01320 [Acidobacteriota bacterium]|nr:hypothetical protein [Acidobacteriota bacterium]
MTLMIGPVMARPVDRKVLDALTEVSVVTTVGERSKFTLTFNISTRSSLHTLFLLTGGSTIPIMRVIVVVTVNGMPNVLIDGVITHQETAPGATPGQSTLTVSGDDLTTVMNQIDFTGFPFPCLPAEARVALMVAKYAFLGIIPMVIPSVLIDIPVPTDRIPVQQGTDYAYIEQLANEVGYSFYLEPGPAPGTSVAYWGPQIRVGPPQPALNIDMDAHTNVESLSFRFDAENASLLILFLQIKALGVSIPIPIPAVTPLSPPLGLIPPIPRNIYRLDGASALGPIRSAAIAMAETAKSSDSVTGTGSLNVQRYGRLLKARQLVGVRGAGTAYDGLYYVSSVTHSIKRGEYKQNFTLVRNGLVSTVQKVPA